MQKHQRLSRLNNHLTDTTIKGQLKHLRICIHVVRKKLYYMKRNITFRKGILLKDRNSHNRPRVFVFKSKTLTKNGGNQLFGVFSWRHFTIKILPLSI